MPRKKKPNTAGVAKTHGGQKSIIILDQEGGIGVTIEGFGPTELDARIDGHRKLKAEVLKQIAAERQLQKEPEGWWNHRVYLLAGAQAFLDAIDASRQVEHQSLFWWPRSGSYQLASCALMPKFIGAGYGKDTTEAAFFSYDSIAKQIALRIRKCTDPKDVAMYQELSRQVETELQTLKEKIAKINEADRQKRLAQERMVAGFAEVADTIVDYDKAWREAPPPQKQPEQPLKTAAEVAVQNAS